MAKQPIFKESYIRELYNKVKSNQGLNSYKNLEFKYDHNQIVHIPNINQPIGLIDKMNPDSDIDSAIAIYEAYENILPLQAADARLWISLAHAELYPYMVRRWNKVYENEAENDYIIKHWFLTSTSQNNLMRHGLSGLWWGVFLSYDLENESDRYHLTRLLFRQLDFLTRTLGLYELARHKEAVMGILEFIEEEEELFKTRFQEKTRYICKYLNLIGGVKPLACFGREFFKNHLRDIKDKIEKV